MNSMSTSIMRFSSVAIQYIFPFKKWGVFTSLYLLPVLLPRCLQDYTQPSRGIESTGKLGLSGLYFDLGSEKNFLIENVQCMPTSLKHVDMLLYIYIYIETLKIHKEKHIDLAV